jgi:hypothetical protein
MRRLELVPTTTFCPHFGRPVAATRNDAISGGRLVDCAEKDACRDPAPEASGPHDHARPFPHGCPVFPSLAR